MRIVGLDVSKGRISACLLTEKPDKPREWFHGNRDSIQDFTADKVGLDSLLSLKPDIAVLEPTGINYSKLWADHLSRNNCLIRWVGHAQLKSYRITLRLPNKNDAADALALACYGHQFFENPDYFLSFDHTGLAHDLRNFCLQIRHLERLTVPLVNRIRQNLSHEFPEVADVDTNGSLWKWLADGSGHKATVTRLNRSYSATVGMGLSDFTRFEATQLVAYEAQIKKFETLLIEMAHRAEFHRYQAVFRQFGFGPRVNALLLSHLYPFGNFLGPDGQEIVEFVKGRNGKPSKRYRSLNSFKLMLGYGLVEDSSGQSDHWIPGGSSLCRAALWQWVFTKIEVRKARPKSAFGKELGDYCDHLKTTGQKVKLIRSKIARKAVEKLFYALLYALA